MNKFISLALLGLIPMIQGQDLWMNSVLDLNVVPPSNWKNSMKFLEGFENGASAGCTMDYRWDSCYGATIDIKSANYPGPMAPEQGCTFNINLPDSLKYQDTDGVNRTYINFQCDEFDINSINPNCAYRGLEISTDNGSVTKKYCDVNSAEILGNTTTIDVVGDSLTLTYVPGESLREGSFSCSLFIPDNYVESVDPNIESC